MDKVKITYIIFMIILIIYLITYKIFKTIEYYDSLISKKNADMCKQIYEEDLNKKYSIIKKLIPENICHEILKEAIDYAIDNNWSLDRHDDYPTTDNQITNKWLSYNYINSLIYNKIFKSISSMYNLNENKLGVNEIFVVKYKYDLQNSLEKHTDGSDFSFIISLNDSEE